MLASWSGYVDNSRDGQRGMLASWSGWLGGLVGLDTASDIIFINFTAVYDFLSSTHMSLNVASVWKFSALLPGFRVFLTLGNFASHSQMESGPCPLCDFVIFLHSWTIQGAAIQPGGLDGQLAWLALVGWS